MNTKERASCEQFHRRHPGCTIEELERTLSISHPTPEKLIDATEEEIAAAMGDLAESYSNGAGEDRNRELPAALQKRLRTLPKENEDPSTVDYGVMLAMFEFGLEAPGVRATFAASPRGLHASERPTHRGNFANYLDRSIAKAEQQYKATAHLESVEITRNNDGIEEDQGRSYSWAELKKDKPAKVQCTIEDILPVGGIATLVGLQKHSGKTTWLFWLVKSLVTGSSFLGRKVRQGPAYYLSEMDPGLVRQYGDAIFNDSDQVHFAFHIHHFRKSWVEVLEYAAEECERRNAKTLIVDTLPRWAKIPDENSAGEMAKALDGLSIFAERGISVLASLHERKSGGTLLERARGSGVATAIPDQIIGLSRVKGNAGNTRKLESIGRLGEFEQIITLMKQGYEVQSQEEKNKEWFDDAKLIHKILAEAEKKLSVSAIEKKVEMRKQRLINLLEWGLENSRWQMEEGERNAKLYSVINSDDEVE